MTLELFLMLREIEPSRCKETFIAGLRRMSDGTVITDSHCRRQNDLRLFTRGEPLPHLEGIPFGFAKGMSKTNQDGSSGSVGRLHIARPGAIFYPGLIFPQLMDDLWPRLPFAVAFLILSFCPQL